MISKNDFADKGEVTMNKTMRFLLPGLALLLAWSSLVLAQNDQPDGERRAGTNAAAELLIPVGARYIAMGGASVATANGLEALYWNPAGLAQASRNANAMFSHMKHIADINVNYLAVSAAFGSFGTLGVSVKALDIGDIIVTTEDAPDGTGGIITPQFIIAGLTYSRALSDRVAVGTTINIVSETIDRVSASGFAFNFGVQYRDLMAINGLSLGVALRNIGPSMQFGGTGLLRSADATDVARGPSPYEIVAGKDELPSALEIGLGYKLPIGERDQINVTATYQDNNFDDDATRAGVEYALNQTLFVRAGYSGAFSAGKDPAGEGRHIYGATLGAGFQSNLGGVEVNLDYAFRQVEFFDNSNVFSLRLGF
jgi:hypothetical protein